jgi:enoyl-CoA hydratase/carnithine racemase
MAFAQITFTKDGNLGLIMLNRPQRLNAWTPQMMAEMREAITACNEDRSIGAIVVSGNGRAFCAGADMANFQQGIDARERGNTPSEGGSREASDWGAFIRGSKPTIAAVNGVAVGIGVTQILPMDVRVCSNQAKFGFLFVKMGLIPELTSSALLPRLVGMGRAREWCLSGRFVLPDEALASGLVTHVFPHEELISRAKEIAREIAEQSRTVVMTIKALLDENALCTDMAAVYRRESEEIEKCFRSWEHKEAVAAFMEKRKPNFSPR